MVYHGGIMQKQKAIQLLGGSVAEAARTLGLTYQAVAKWPDDLSERLSDRVEGFLLRQEREAEAAKAKKTKRAKPSTAAHAAASSVTDKPSSRKGR
jgi:molybdenum-dependent DNA-binding transcriptional regulator ModE